MTNAFDEVIHFIAAGCTPQDVIAFKPSPEAQARFEMLLAGSKAGTLSQDEASELRHCMEVEHIMRMVKARARQHQPDRKAKTLDEIEQENPALAAAIARLNSRTPEEILAARERILASAPEPLPLPEGKTMNDVILGQWPGDETDEEIFAALRELS